MVDAPKPSERLSLRGEGEFLADRWTLDKRKSRRSRDFLPRGWRIVAGGQRARSGNPSHARGIVPTRSEFTAACLLATLLAVAWFQWSPTEKASSLAAAPADTIEGRASVIDGDTIDIHGERIRILDIDAPESKQTCTAQNGSEWRCGQKAALALSDWIAQQTVTCATTTRDKYDRHLARCSVAGQDLGQWMAANGWAVPYRDCKCEVVRDAGAQAKASQLGIWAGTFMLPWEWRAQETAKSNATGQQITPGNSNACQIKGNISSKGERIYHVPGGRWYDATKVDEGKGERWFCSESEAQAAGWRPAKQ
jgi:endonuclease YncB( thermonuclease family)